MVDKVLEERGKRYGDFKDHARYSQQIKIVMENSPNWIAMPLFMKESLEMIAHKIARILNGDPKYKDSWVDIEGYARLVSKELKD